MSRKDSTARGKYKEECKGKVRTRNHQCWKDYAGPYRPCKNFCHSAKDTQKALKDFMKEGVCVCVCVRECMNVLLCLIIR